MHTTTSTSLVHRHPVTVFAVAAILPTWAVQFTFLALGWELFPALLIELLFLLGAATAVTAVTSGRDGVRRLFTPAMRWRFGGVRFAVALLAVPLTTVAVAAATGTLRAPADGWTSEILTYLFLTLIYGAVLGNVWEETAWAGFAQARLMERHGLVRGSLLTAIPFALIHLPLAFEDHGLAGTTGRDLAISWTFLAVFAPLVRYLAGAWLLDTGSVLAVAIVHASINGAQSLTVAGGEWQFVTALVLVTAATGAHRSRQVR
jgi:membrane protease YdiL (CAAX protease family)